MFRFFIRTYQAFWWKGIFSWAFRKCPRVVYSYKSKSETVLVTNESPLGLPLGPSSAFSCVYNYKVMPVFCQEVQKDHFWLNYDIGHFTGPPTWKWPSKTVLNPEDLRKRFSACSLNFLPSCAKYHAVGNMVAETGRDLVFMTTARLNGLSMPLKGDVRRSPEQSAWQSIAKSGKFVRHASSRGALGCEETTVLCFLPSWSTLQFERGSGEGGRFDVASRSETPNSQRPAAKTTNSNCCDRAAAQVKQHIPEQPGWKNSKYWAKNE